MRLGQRFLDGEGDTFQIHQVHDYTGVAEAAKALRSERPQTGDNRLVARIPAKAFSEYLKRHGVKHDDPAAEDLMARFLTERDYAQFRVWEGNI